MGPEAGIADPSQRRERLVELYHLASACVSCPLSETRTRVVFGAGNSNAELIFVGEGPGAEEDRRGLPFVGRAGQLLNQLLEGIGLSREEVFITNTVKCLRYNARVQLGDGSWERIGRLVRSRYDGLVRSVDADGCIVNKRVTGWHASPVGDRSVYHLTFRSAKRAGAGRTGIELTGDHPVLTEAGYVEARTLKPGMRVSTGQGMSTSAFEAVCGSLLGDGSIFRRSSAFGLSHSHRQADYVEFKAQLLEELAPVVKQFKVAAVANGPQVYDVVHLSTPAHRSLRILRGQFYADRKRVPEWLADGLTPRMLAVWFMDDGHMRVREGGRRPLAEIATNGFENEDLQTLIRGLSNLGLVAKALRGRLFFDTNMTSRLSSMIAPFVPSSMRYKVSPEVSPHVPFDPGRWSRGPSIGLFDDVVAVDVSERPRKDRTFFCLDVEDTNNFVTSGGVVHNCRPPGNRDPQPGELEACRPYLDRQLQLIEPKVVATLGNFATKLITGNQTGITKVRGTPQLHELAGRSVYVFPLLHPAAALRTPKMKDLLVEDFGRLRELLDGPPPPAAEREAEAAPEGAEPAAAGLEGTGARPPDTSQLDIFGA